MHLIFRWGKFVGFVEKKKDLKAFRRERKSIEYEVREAENVTGEFFEEHPLGFNLHALTFYPQYECYLFGFEAVAVTRLVMARVLHLQQSIRRVYNVQRYLKLSDEDLAGLDRYCTFIENLIGDLTHEETCVNLNDYFDVRPILEKVIAESPNITVRT